MSFKFTKQNRARLTRFAKRKRRTMTSVLEEFIEKGCMFAKEEV